jgi:hypothetical protein
MPNEMKNIVFIRSLASAQCWDYYESKTEAWVFGDIGGFEYLRKCFLNAKSLEANVHLNEIDPGSNSMRVVVIPSSKSLVDRARIKIIERFIKVDGIPNMELVFFGNDLGYDYLANKLGTMLKNPNSDVSDHFHLDDINDTCLVKRSVSLNVRAPLSKWDREALREYAPLVFEKIEAFLPNEIECAPDEEIAYQELSPIQSDFLRLE